MNTANDTFDPVVSRGSAAHRSITEESFDELTSSADTCDPGNYRCTWRACRGTRSRT